MSAIKAPVAPDSAVELRELIGDDATATFESIPGFIDSGATDHGTSENIEVQRDTDDTEDSEEEEDELEDEDLDEDEDEELEDDDEEEDEEEEEDDDDEDDDDEEGEDDEDEVGVMGVQATASMRLPGDPVNGKTSIDSSLEEDDDQGDEGEMHDEYEIEDANDEDETGDRTNTDRGIDAALRLNALVKVTSEFAANL